MTRRLTFLFAVAGGAAVANLYWAQPLLDFIARDLHASAASAGWLVTATQVGYAAGILLIVPLGDVVNRRRLIPAMMACAAVALVGCALAPSFGVLLVAITVLGLTTVAGQLLTPLAGDLADDAQRGQVVGIVVSGILTGILVSRTLSGLIADAAGWRVVFAVAAAADVVFAIVLYRAIPPLAPKARLPYPALIASVGAVIRRERALRWTMVLGATGFGVFTMFWTALIAFVVAAVAGRTVAGVLVAIVLLDIAIQSANILNQSRLFTLSGEARSRLNTAYITGNFIGGAIGSAAASVLWSAGGWTAVSITAVALSCFALAVWAAGRRGPLVVASELT